MALVSIFAVAQTSNYNQVVWLNGKMMYATPIPAIDSITFSDEMTEQDTLHLIMPRTIVRILHDTVYKHDTIYINTCKEDAKAIGKFSVSADKQVAFAPGNLQYQASSDTWRFAEHQYGYIGAANSKISATYTGRIDLFGWGTGNNPTQSSTNTSDYQTFVDWGTNQIGDDAPNTWRTLTIDEWTYLFQHTRWTMVKVNNVLGFMLLPTDFTAPSGMTVVVLGDGNMSDSDKSFNESDYADNQYTVEQFAQFEAQGCVFLPCAGCRYGSGVLNVGSYGYYWSATPYDSDYAGGLYFGSTDANTGSYWNRFLGQSVRLVQDLK